MQAFIQTRSILTNQHTIFVIVIIYVITYKIFSSTNVFQLSMCMINKKGSKPEPHGTPLNIKITTAISISEALFCSQIPALHIASGRPFPYQGKPNLQGQVIRVNFLIRTAPKRQRVKIAISTVSIKVHGLRGPSVFVRQ